MRPQFVGDLTEAEAGKEYAVAELGLDPGYPLLRLEMAARDSGENLFDTLGLMMDEPEIEADPSKLAGLRLAVCGWMFKKKRYYLQAAALRVWLMAIHLVSCGCGGQYEKSQGEHQDIHPSTREGISRQPDGPPASHDDHALRSI